MVINYNKTKFLVLCDFEKKSLRKTVSYINILKLLLDYWFVFKRDLNSYGRNKYITVSFLEINKNLSKNGDLKYLIY